MSKRKEQPPPIPDEPIHLLTIVEVAERLRIKRTSVYSLIHHEGLPTVTVGKSMRVVEQSLQRWIMEHERVS